MSNAAVLLLVCSACLLQVTEAQVRAADPTQPSAPQVNFVDDVQPILRQRCYECHATGNEEAGLNLAVRAHAMKGGDNGPVIVPGQSDDSPLMTRVTSQDPETMMPPEGERLTPQQVAILQTWIDHGAHWPDNADSSDPRLDRARDHWAFQPLKAVQLPEVQAERVLTPIDRFIWEKLEDRGLSLAPAASPRKLIRRLMFDLIGLPPSPREVEEFLAEYESDRTSAIERLVDRLLASPHFGERWGRHWLDVARYADSSGQEGDQDRPSAYHYRDFVIRAFNDDLPFDQFVRWQLAGDEYAPDERAALAATGFIIAGPNTALGKGFLEEELLRNRYNELDDMLATTGSAFLGLTLGCARCHDHKYDAITARDYYSLLSAFHTGDRIEIQIHGQGPKILAFCESTTDPAPTWLFDRADFYDRDEPVSLGFLNVLMRGTTVEDYQQRAALDRPKPDSTYQRKALAEWMTDVDHGAGALLARVIVNRLWQHHFGEGLVRTVDDFGVRGELPTHPELLEWLAHDLVAGGWRLKRLHRAIVTSAVYQQGTDFNSASAQVDPENRLLSRRRPLRLEAEILRDSMLAVSGTLNAQAYGRAFKPPIPAEAITARNLKSKYPDDARDEPGTRRRTVYMFHKRIVPYPLLQAFDRPDLLQSCGRRDQSTVAPQSLAILNDPFVRSRAYDFARRLLSEEPEDDAQLADHAFKLALGRPPDATERNACMDFLALQQQQRFAREPSLPTTQVREAAIADFCQTLFGLNEFLYVD